MAFPFSECKGSAFGIIRQRISEVFLLRDEKNEKCGVHTDYIGKNIQKKLGDNKIVSTFVAAFIGVSRHIRKRSVLLILRMKT